MRKRQDMSSEKQSLKDKLTAIILLETSKDYKEMDSDLVTECVDFLMELEGKEKITEEEHKNRIESIPFEGRITASPKSAKKKFNFRRFIAVAAVIAVLFTMFSVLATSFTDFEDNLMDRIANYIVDVMKPGERKKYGNVTVYKANEEKTYSSAQALAKDNKTAILAPTWLPDGKTVTLYEYVYFETDGVTYNLYTDDPECGVSICPGDKLPDEVKEANKSVEVGGHTVCLIVRDGVVQGDFEYNGCLYTAIAHSEEDVLKIIENLKEIK